MQVRTMENSTDSRQPFKRESPSDLAAISEELKVKIAQKEARIRHLCEKHDIQLDLETQEIINYIVQGAVMQGGEKLLSKDWLISMELRLLHLTKRDSTKQRILEHLSDLLGYSPQQSSKKDNWADVVIGEAISG